MPEQPPELVVPTDLALVPLDDLRELETRAVAEFTRLEEAEVTPDNVDRAIQISDDLGRVRDEIQIKEQRAQAAAAREKEQLESRMHQLGGKVRPGEQAEGGEGEGGGGTALLTRPDLDEAAIEKIVAAASQGTMAALVQADPHRRFTTTPRGSLADAQQHVPDPKAPDSQLVVTASVDVPGRSGGDRLTFDDMVDAYHKVGRNLQDTTPKNGGVGAPENGKIVATVRQAFEYTVDDRTPLPQVEELFNFLQGSKDAEALLAGGGWCAPSQITYDFFNIACEDGLVDLPTVGITRGGVRFPVSPSMADMQLSPFVSAFSNASNPWLWTETDDQATVTGTPNKPCFRVPCPTFDERRLECYGVCLTAGNLTNDAYPEATTNTLRLLMAAHAHAMNARLIQTMVGLSTAAITGGEFASGTANSAFNQILGGLSLAAADYRARYGMCQDDVLEAVIPYWILDAVQADLAWRGSDPGFLSITKAQIRGYLADRNIRAQFVGDWQIRGASQFGNATAMTAWPTTVTAMLYAAGTFIKGNGLTLDLGVVRDSTLNAENDYTAAWSEECHLVGRVGHESRQYTITFNVGGANVGGAGTPPNL